MNDESERERWERDRRLAANVRQVQQDSVWQADSPEQALAWLRWYLYGPAKVFKHTQTPTGTLLELPQRVFFRGQANARWDLLPSLHRLQGAQQQKAAAATALATSVIKAEFDLLWSRDSTQHWPPLTQKSALAAAQHYGFATPLLDWSANPAVAVDFATRRKEPDIEPLAAVHWLTAGDAAALGLQLVLPPAYVQRLYLQRGVFTAVTAGTSSALTARSRKIVFPATPPLRAQFTTDGQHGFEVDLEPGDAWFNALREWSLDHAGGPMQNWQPVMLAARFTQEHGHHPALQNFSEIEGMFAAETHAGPMVAFIDALARRIGHTQDCYDPRVLGLIERDNAGLLQWFQLHGITFPRCGSQMPG